MNKNLTEIVFILDRSGSMSGLESDTIGGFNAMIEKQKKAPGEALVSTILFDNVSEVIHDRVNIRDIKPMTDREYCVHGCTALLDAIGGAIHHIGNVHKYAREEDVPAHTLFVITTDGMENASRRYDSARVKQMIEHEKSKYGWEFLFLGANIDAVETAKQRAKEEAAAEKQRAKEEAAEEKRRQKLEDEERRRAQKLEDEARRKAERAAEAEQKKLERQREREAAAAKKKAERLQSKIETQLVSAGGQILKRGLLGILKR